MSFLSHFSFFVLGDEVTKNRLRDFLYNECQLLSICKARQVRQKLKIMIKKPYYVIFSFLVTFVNQNENEKWDEKLKRKSITNTMY